MGATPRYFVSITPFNVGESVYQTDDDVFGVYDSKEVLSMKNRQFTFVVSKDCRYYSYYTSGFTVNISRQF